MKSNFTSVGTGILTSLRAFQEQDSHDKDFVR